MLENNILIRIISASEVFSIIPLLQKPGDYKVSETLL